LLLFLNVARSYQFLSPLRHNSVTGGNLGVTNFILSEIFDIFPLIRIGLDKLKTLKLFSFRVYSIK